MNKTIMIAQQIAQVSVLSDSVINGYKKRYFACLKKAYMIIYLPGNYLNDIIDYGFYQMACSVECSNTYVFTDFCIRILS